LQYAFKDFGREADHLQKHGDTNRDETIKKVRELTENKLSQRQIARELNLAVSTVNRMLQGGV
jgi:IS30 family transposase